MKWFLKYLGYKSTGKVNTIDMLIKYGANLHCPDNQGRTALHSAALAGNNKVVLALLNWGASINATTARGDTALMLAKRVKREACVKLLKTMVLMFFSFSFSLFTFMWTSLKFILARIDHVLHNDNKQMKFC